MRNIINWSGGKDSTATVILAHQHKIPVDKIIMAEIMFDHERNISAEHPAHIDFVRNVAKPKFQSWGYDVEIIQSEKDAISIMKKELKNSKYPERNGKLYGAPIPAMCSIAGRCKIPTLEKIKREFLAKDDVTQLIGIASDETDRLERLHKQKNQVSLLEKYGYTIRMAYSLCKSYGLLSPVYDFSVWQGCWFCPNATAFELVYLIKNYPEVWNIFDKEILNNPNNVYYPMDRNKYYKRINKFLKNNKK